MTESLGASDTKFDFIVVGAGSAGSAAASRLSEDPGVHVLLVEAGPENKSWQMDMPLALEGLVSGARFNWAYSTEPEPHLGGRRISHPRGRVLGGSSSINGMVYTRGNALDFERWAREFGCTGWDYASVLPYFKRCESSDRGENVYRGATGPLKVTTPKLDDNPLNRAFIDAGCQAGYPKAEDSNAYCQEGFGPNEQTIFMGKRCSSANAYLSPPVRRRRNLTILTNARVERLLLREKRVLGVQLWQDGNRFEAYCQREVILCGGAFASPQIMLLSGIGPTEALSRASIPMLHELPGVGRNLQDHPDWTLQVQCLRKVTLLPATRQPKKLLVGLEWFLAKRGPAASNQFEASAYLRTRAGVQYPNLKLELLPLAFQPGGFLPYPMPAFQIHMTLLASQSRGEVTLSGPDSSAPPRIVFNYLADPQDLATMREAVSVTREVVAQAALSDFAGTELQPGADIRDGAALDDWLRANLGTAYHPSGTCRMGPTPDDKAVVGPDLKVRGLDGLRVADASIMPLVVAANTNATSIMIGDRVADFALGRTPLSPEEAPYWFNPHWQSRQR